MAVDGRLRSPWNQQPSNVRRTSVDWLERHHGSEPELWVGYFKKASGRASMTWPESVDEALCYGWIDGIRKRIDDERYMIRFTPRRAGSIWSAVNIGRVAVLTEEGRMRPAGREAFEARREDRSGIYSYERRDEAVLSAGVREALPREEASVGVVRGTAEGIPAEHDPVGHEREAAGNAGAPSRHADGGLRRGPQDRAAQDESGDGRRPSPDRWTSTCPFPPRSGSGGERRSGTTPGWMDRHPDPRTRS